MNNTIGTEQLKPIVWMKPDVLPDKPVDGEDAKQCWVAFDVKHLKEPDIFLAKFEWGDWYFEGDCLINSAWGELLAWAEYTPPTFQELLTDD